MTCRHDRPADRPPRASGAASPRSSRSDRPTRAGSIEIPLARIRENPRQPRLRMDDDALASLAESIRQHGVIQPILVTETIDGYQLVAGERRVRAARMAGLERIPAIVRQLADREQLELALVENLQREDLDPIEAARAYRQLIDEFAFTRRSSRPASGAPGPRSRTRSACSSSTSRAGRDRDGLLTEGHARALGGLPAEGPGPGCSAVIVDEGLRPADRGARPSPPRAPPSSPRPARPAADPEVERVEEDLRRSLGTKVRLTRTRRGGRIVIEYYGDDELARIYQRLIGGAA